jgi:transcriptional regulator with XRE-family HTH domain
MAKRLLLSEQMRRLILEADVTQYQIAKDTGIYRASLSRFVRGEHGLSQEHLDLLGKYLNWTITVKKD